MPKPLVSDELSAVVEPLLPPPREMLSPEMNCGSGVTCWRRLRDGQNAGVWQKLHEVLLLRLQPTERIEWSRVSIDASSVPTLKGGHRAKPDGPKKIGYEAPSYDRSQRSHSSNEGQCL